ncbi:MAG TPA: hypothetical protein VFK89_04015 [Actinomycetota bacterium]|nr:hypothetical protein [Actinomycetota bacterium]
MRAATIAIVAVGIAVAVFAGLSSGFDAVSVVILLLLIAFGALAIAVTRKAGSGIRPATCPECGGLLSPHAPYCKHCGAPTEAADPQK